MRELDSTMLELFDNKVDKTISELCEILEKDDSLRDKRLRHKFMEMARVFESKIQENVFLTSHELAKNYATQGFAKAGEWRDFLEQASVALYKKNIIDEILKTNADKTLALNELSNNDALKIRNDSKEGENANVVVFFMGMRDYGGQKKIEKYEGKSPDVLVKQKHLSGDVDYRCPVCEVGTTTVHFPNFYGVCDTCGATAITFVPLEHQAGVLQRKETFKLVLGGYGSGKTSLTTADFFAHALTTPNGRGAVVAQTLDQVQRTVWREIKKFIPDHLIKKETKRPMEMTLINGYEILVYASDDEEKIRSLEVDYFYIEEASAPRMKFIFDQATSRIRRPTGKIFDKMGNEIGSKYQIMVVSNPEDTWYMEDFILKSKHITASPAVNKEVYEKLRIDDPTEQYHTFLSSTRDNTYLPKDYLPNLTAGKSQEWIKKYVDCYLDVKEGRIYDEYLDYFEAPFEIPNHWRRVAGYDFGVNDPTTFIIGAEHPETGVVYFYDEYSQNNRPIDVHAEHIRNMMSYKNTRGETVFYDMAFPIQADPAVKKRNERDLQSHQDYFRKRSGLYLEPADNRIMFGIAKVKNMGYLKRFKIFENLSKTKEEFRNYVYKVDRNTGLPMDEPIDRYNHLMDALRYAIVRMPENYKPSASYAQPSFYEGELGAHVYSPYTNDRSRVSVGKGRAFSVKPRIGGIMNGSDR